MSPTWDPERRTLHSPAPLHDYLNALPAVSPTGCSEAGWPGGPHTAAVVTRLLTGPRMQCLMLLGCLSQTAALFLGHRPMKTPRAPSVEEQNSDFLSSVIHVCSLSTYMLF